MALMKNRNIIFFGLQPWDIEIGSNFKNMARIMSKDNRILYVNRPLDMIHRLRHSRNKRVRTRLASIRKNENALNEVEKNIHVLNPRITVASINKLPEGKLYRYWNKKNNKKIAKEIKEYADQLKFSDPVLIIDNDFFNGLYLKELLDPTLFIYYLRDYLRSQPYFQKHGNISEPQIIREADIVLTNSLYLQKYAREYNPLAFDIGQGCEVDEFMQTGQLLPEDMKKIPTPLIGYCGMLTGARLDISLIKDLAVERPKWSFVLVGPQDEKFLQSDLHSIKNIYFLGAKEPSELPAYVRHFDVCINPQVLNQMTIGNYPRKIDEYLAAGKPVVATKTEAMEYFAEVVYLCETGQDYIDKISIALKKSNDETLISQRIAFAASHTWEASVNKLYQFAEKRLANEISGRGD